MCAMKFRMIGNNFHNEKNFLLHNQYLYLKFSFAHLPFLVLLWHHSNIPPPPVWLVPQLALHQIQPAPTPAASLPAYTYVDIIISHPRGSVTSSTICDPGSSTRLSTGSNGRREGSSLRAFLPPDIAQPNYQAPQLQPRASWGTLKKRVYTCTYVQSPCVWS